MENGGEEKLEEGNKQVEAANGDGDWEDWAAPDLLIESELSGSDYEEACCELEKKRAWCKSRGRSVTDTEEEDARINEEDAEEEHDLECDKQEEAHSTATCNQLSTIKREGKAPTSSDAHWEELRASFTPSQLDTASVLNSYGLTLMPTALLPDLEEISSTKPSLMEVALYPMFGEIVWQHAHRFTHLYGRSLEFAMEKAGLLRKEKRAPNRYSHPPLNDTPPPFDTLLYTL